MHLKPAVHTQSLHLPVSDCEMFSETVPPVPTQLVAAILTVYSSLYARVKVATGWILVVVER